MGVHSIYSNTSRWVLVLVVTLTCQFYLTVSIAIGSDSGPVAPVTTRMSPGLKIESPSSKPESENWLVRNKLWVALGTLILGGGVAAATAGGSGGDDGEACDTGTYESGW